MAGAKLKEGLDYYPTTTRTDQRFRIIKALHGNDGYVILDYLLKDIYGERGYYIKWNDRMAKFFASEYGFNFETVKAVVSDCLYEGIFEEEKFNEHQILTSKEIQEIWINVAKERKVVIHVKEYLILDIQPFLKSANKTTPINETELQEILQGSESLESSESISPGINSINPGINCKNPPENRQSKVKQSIAEQSEAKKSEEEEKKEKETEIFKKELSEANFFSLSANPLEKKEEIFFQKKIDPPDIKPAEISEKREKENFSKKEIPDVAPENPQIKSSEKPKEAEISSSVESPCEDDTEIVLNRQRGQEEPCGNTGADTGDATGKAEKETSHRISGIPENIPKRENSGQTVIPEILSSPEKTEGPPEPEKQEKPGTSEEPEKREKSDYTGKTGTKAKSGKQIMRVNKPHPVRPFIIKLWEDKFGQPYPNSFKGNIAIKGVIRHLEGLIKRSRKDLMVNEEEINNQIVELWKVILHNWDKLDKFYRNMITLERIEKYLTEIINQLKVNGTERSKSSPNGAKPSFDRFRKKYG